MSRSNTNAKKKAGGDISQHFHKNDKSSSSSDPPSPRLSQLDKDETAQPTPSTKEDFLALRSLIMDFKESMESKLDKAVASIRSDLSSLSARTSKLESRQDSLQKVQTELIRDVDHIIQDLSDLRAKNEDLENRERRCNLRIRNIPESVPPADLEAYLHRLFSYVVPDIGSRQLKLERAHRALRPKPRANDPPRDVIIRFLSFKDKELVLHPTRGKPHILFEDAKLQFYQDLAPSTIIKRRELRDLTSALRTRGIRYRWGFPFKLLIDLNGKTIVIRDPAEGKDFLAHLEDSGPPPTNHTNP